MLYNPNCIVLLYYTNGNFFVVEMQERDKVSFNTQTAHVVCVLKEALSLSLHLHHKKVSICVIQKHNAIWVFNITQTKF